MREAADGADPPVRWSGILEQGPDAGQRSSSDRPPDVSSPQRLGGFDPWGMGGERGWAWWDTGQDNSSAGWVEIE